eukprot:SAG11_NODE_26447_length_345_cov_0.784553_1_plen_110_part_01
MDVLQTRYENRNRSRVAEWLAGSADWAASSECSSVTASADTTCRRPSAASNAIAKQANQAFKERDFSRAAALYSRALESGAPSYSVLINRSLTYLKLGDFKNALDDADAA